MSVYGELVYVVVWWCLINNGVCCCLFWTSRLFVVEKVDHYTGRAGRSRFMVEQKDCCP